MAVDKLVDSNQLDANLTSVANAIRAKGGTSSQMAFPAGFVSAVQAIPTGTTPTGTKQISITQNGTTTEDVAAYANAEITVNVSGGDAGYALLASGEYTKETVASGTMSIPVSYSGTPAFAYVVANSIIADTNQSYAFIIIPENGLPFSQFLQNGKTGITSAVNSSGTLATNAINATNGISANSISCSRASNTYLIQPNTYNWFIYGIANGT